MSGFVYPKYPWRLVGSPLEYSGSPFQKTTKSLPDPVADWYTPFGKVIYDPKNGTSTLIPREDGLPARPMKLKKKYRGIA